MSFVNKIKIALFILFIVANGLLISYYVANNQTGFVNSNVINDAKRIMANKNITLENDKLPNLPKRANKYVASNGMATKQDIATHILGVDCVMLDVNVYQNDEYNMWINGCNYDILPTAESAPMVTKPLAAAEKDCMEWLDTHGLKDKYTKASQVVLIPEESLVKCSFNKVLDGVPIVGAYINVWCNGNGVTKVEGRNWLNSTFEITSRDKILSVAELLVNFANSRSSTDALIINSVELVYYIPNRVAEKVSIEMVPALQINADNGIFYVNAIDGKRI
ncbi:MAG: hypothetical protein LBM38_02375 [Clostridiales bacterium]|jgi:hypothetical protein|nr:hypothetical protein [Clostridiales bacterium]